MGDPIGKTKRTYSTQTCTIRYTQADSKGCPRVVIQTAPTTEQPAGSNVALYVEQEVTYVELRDVDDKIVDKAKIGNSK